ncbi:MATE family efflux transporter [Thermodesulfobacteriota bacterium]
MMGPTIDMIWVGKLGSAAIAGVGIAGTAVMLMMAAMMGLAQGTRAIVARFVGRGDTEGANHVAMQGFIISALYSIFMVSIGIFFSEAILTIIGVEADVVAEGAAYMRIMFIGATARSFRMVSEGVMQSSGDALTPMKISILLRIVHVIICPFLIFGWLAFPRMGTSGAAMANVISHGMGLVIALWILFHGGTRIRLTLRNFGVDFNMIWRIVKIGIPAAVMGMQRGASQLILMLFMVPFGTTAVAAHTVFNRVEMLLAMVCMGMGISAGVLAGQNLGAKKPIRAEKTGWLAIGLAEGLMVICAGAILVWPEMIIKIFNTEPEFIKTGSVFLRIGAVGFLMMGFGPTFMHVLSGVGDTFPPMLIAILTTWGVLIPLAVILPRITNLGVYGVRWAIVASLFVSAVAYITYFKMGKWKLKKV